MRAILKEIKFCEHEDYTPHRIAMMFSEETNDEELYVFGTTIEVQYCIKEKFIGGISDSLFKKKKAFAEKQIGRMFEINLYKFTVRELTNDKYVAFEVSIFDPYDCGASETLKDYHIASYMTIEDVKMKLKFGITMAGIEGHAEGVLPDNSTEIITTELFFPTPPPEKKHFDIPYSKYSNLTTSYIISEVAVNDIRKGRNLAYQIKEQDIPYYEFDKYIRQIEDYRSSVRNAKAINESLRKKIFFWKPKVVIEELKLKQNVVSLFKDCIILGKCYPAECNKADHEYAKECEKTLRKQFLGEDMDEKEFKDKWFDFIQALKKKYKGRETIRPID